MELYSILKILPKTVLVATVWYIHRHSLQSYLLVLRKLLMKNHKLYKISASSKSFIQNPMWGHGKCTYFSSLTYRGQVVISRKDTNSYFWIKGRGTCLFLEHNFELKDRFLDQKWLLKVAYLSDIFTKINELNFTLQGRQVNVFTAHEKIHTFKKKLDFWKICMSSNEFDYFPTIKCFLE